MDKMKRQGALLEGLRKRNLLPIIQQLQGAVSKDTAELDDTTLGQVGPLAKSGVLGPEIQRLYATGNPVQVGVQQRLKILKKLQGFFQTLRRNGVVPENQESFRGV